MMRKYYKALISIIFLCFFSLTAYASGYDTIKIGLESVYKDAATIKLSSEKDISVGYMKGSHFQKEGSLKSNTIHISKASGSYYFMADIFTSLEEAQEVAKSYGGGVVVGYLAPNTYGIYSKEQKENFMDAGTSRTRVAIYNAENELIFISDNGDEPLLFQGGKNSYDFGLTKVGATREYRGAIGVINGQGGGLTAYNHVGMEDYLYGVVPSEMVPSWPIEALKAQAVAARSMANYQYSRYISRGYNLVDTTASQVYKGFTVEKESTNRAVDETAGQIALYNGKVAETLYFSTSGGTTEDAKNVWGNTVPYLQAVKDTYELEPEQGPWKRTMTLEEVNSCLNALGANIGKAQGVQIVSRTPSGRVAELKIIGTNGEYSLKNENVRTFFAYSKEGSLKSRLFSFLGYMTPTLETMPEVTTKVEPIEAYIMSQNDLIEKDLKGLVVMSAYDMETLGEEVVVESQSGKTTLKEEIVTSGGGSSTGNGGNAFLQSETVMGDFTVYGQGFGHGVGMSQSGAKGMAKVGYTYDEILKYYYKGITIGY